MVSPLLAAISLGITGPLRFAQRACRNEGLFHLGNGLVNVLILLSAPIFGTPVLFWAMGLTALASVAAALAVPEDAIDHAVARGLLPGAVAAPTALTALRLVAASRPLLLFALCCALFHLANRSMLGLVAQELALAHPGQGIALTAASKRSDAGRFVVLPRRWIVERTIAWLNRCRRLAKDWERLNQNALAFLRWASIRLMVRRLCQTNV